MAKNLSTLTITSPADPLNTDSPNSFTFEVTPGFSGGGIIVAYDLDFQWDQGTASWQTIPATGSLETADTNPISSTSSDVATSITVDTTAAGSFDIRVVNVSRTITSGTQTVNVSGQQTFEVTLTGANNYAAVTDPVPVVQVTAIREKTLQDLDSAAVTDPAPTATYVPFATVNEVTLSDVIYCSDALWIPLVFSTARRERNRESLESVTLLDAHLELRDRDRASVEAIAVDDVASNWIESNEQNVEVIDTADDSIEARLRYRVLSDSIVIEDDKTATYVPDATGVINKKTLQDLDSIAATDTIGASRLRDRSATDSIEATDSDTELRLRDRALFDSIIVEDDKTATYIPPGSVTYNRTLQDLDSAATIDTVEQLRLRDRSATDALAATDDKTATYIPPGSVTYNRTLQDLDSVSVADNSISLRERIRLDTNTIVVEDDKTATYSPAGSTIYSRTLQDLDSITVVDTDTPLRDRDRIRSDTLSVGDDSKDFIARNRQPLDTILVEDNIVSEADRRLQRTDSIDLSETVESVRERIRTLSDNASISDSIIVTTDQTIKTVTLADTLSITDSIIAQRIIDAGQFYVRFGIEALEVEYGLSLVHNVTYGIKEETS